MHLSRGRGADREAPRPPHWFFREQRGEAVLLSLESPSLPGQAAQTFFCIPLLLLFCVTPGRAQKAQQGDGSIPKYDLHTEMKIKGIVDEVNLLPLGTRKDFTELIIKAGDDKVHIYVCPKPFQDEMGIRFGKGDEIAVTGSKVKQQAFDVILARELVKGTDTLLFRDDKGNPVWDWRTGK
jgi:hypothetical protein